jgi:hypothetical protein
MPRSLSRMTLEVISLRVEKLSEISEDDARASGLVDTMHGPRPGYRHYGEGNFVWSRTPREAHRHVWDYENGARYRDADPEVIAFSFKPIMQNINDVLAAGEAAA